MTLSIIRGRYVIVFRIVTAHKFRDLCCPLENVGSLSKLKKIHRIPYNEVCMY